MTEAIERGRELAASGVYAPSHNGVDEGPQPDEPPGDGGAQQPPESPADGDSESVAGRRSVAAQLVDMARSHYRLGVTDTDDPFGVSVEAPHIALMLRGGKTGLRAELSRRFFAETNTVASQQALADACMVLEGFAAQENPQRVYLRAAEHGGVVYIDMGDATNRVIEISGGTWRIATTAPVLFRRTKLTGELPTPATGNGRQIWDFVGIDVADRPILLAVMVAALIQVDVPHVVLLLLAEQGSAKSTVTRILVSLIDPSAVPLRQPPRDPDGWTTAAAASWVVALDNLSGDVDGWLSDCLCRASTGDGSVKRALYTDSDVSVLAFRRCIIANGVDVSPVRGDLAERVATIGLPRITGRRAESEFEAEWESARPAVFGALLDLAAKVHHLLPTIEADDLPRMADFAKVLAGVDKVLNSKGLDRYTERSRRSAADTLDVPFVAELVAAGRAFEATTSAELLVALTPPSPDWRPKKGWPKSARAVTGLLTRHAPAMRAQGWQIDNDEGRSKDKVTRWTIRPPEPEKGCKGDPPDPRNPSAQVNGHKSGGLTENGSPAGHSPNPRGGVTVQATGQGENAGPPDLPGLTCKDGPAGQAGQEYGASLVVCGCGVELSRPDSVARGYCAECAVSSKQVVDQ